MSKGKIKALCIFVLIIFTINVGNIFANITSLKDASSKSGVENDSDISIEDKKDDNEVKEEKRFDITLNITEDKLFENGVNIEDKDKYLSSLIKGVNKSLEDDVIVGFEALFNNDGIFDDHVSLKRWGKFLYDYANKPVSSMPIEDINLGELDGKTVGLKLTKESKDWVKYELIDSMLGTIIDVSISYSCDIYNFKPSNAVLLSEFNESMISSNMYNSSITPLSNSVFESSSIDKDSIDKSNIVVHSIGKDYGLALSNNFSSLMSEIYKKDGAYIKNTSKGNKNSCIKVVAYVSTLKNIGEDITLINKGLKDVSLYSGLAYNIVSKKMVMISGTNNYEFSEVELKDDEDKTKDNKNKDAIDVSKFMLVPLKDEVALMPTEYIEAFPYKGKVLPTGSTIDVSEFLLNGNNILNLSNGQQYDIANYVAEEGVIQSEITDKGNIIITCPSNKLPYDRITKWLISEEGKSQVSEFERNESLTKIQEIYKSQGKSKEWKELIKGYKMPSKTPIIVFLLVVAIILVIVGVFLKRRERSKNDEDLLLFQIDEKERDDMYDEHNEF